MNSNIDTLTKELNNLNVNTFPERNCTSKATGVKCGQMFRPTSEKQTACIKCIGAFQASKKAAEQPKPITSKISDRKCTSKTTGAKCGNMFAPTSEKQTACIRCIEAFKAKKDDPIMFI